MTFEIKGKVALISGGASGIGLGCAKELLRNGLRGVVLADINNECGTNAVTEINNEFGVGKVLFVKTDVSNKDNYEDAFKKAIAHFQNLDILINNAGIMDDKAWEREIAINLNGTINGIILALENYIPKYRTSQEGVIVNVSSIAGVHAARPLPIYSATKFGVRALSLAFGDNLHYTRTQVKVFAVCPGVTETAIFDNSEEKVLSSEYHSALGESLGALKTQSSAHVSESIMNLIKTAKSGTIWLVEGGKEAYEFVDTENV